MHTFCTAETCHWRCGTYRVQVKVLALPVYPAVPTTLHWSPQEPCQLHHEEEEEEELCAHCGFLLESVGTCEFPASFSFNCCKVDNACLKSGLRCTGTYRNLSCSNEATNYFYNSNILVVVKWWV